MVFDVEACPDEVPVSASSPRRMNGKRTTSLWLPGSRAAAAAPRSPAGVSRRCLSVASLAFPPIQRYVTTMLWHSPSTVRRLHSYAGVACCAKARGTLRIGPRQRFTVAGSAGRLAGRLPECRDTERARRDAVVSTFDGLVVIVSVHRSMMRCRDRHSSRRGGAITPSLSAIGRRDAGATSPPRRRW